MHWDWASFGIGCTTGLLLGVVVVGLGLYLFAMGMRDD